MEISQDEIQMLVVFTLSCGPLIVLMVLIFVVRDEQRDRIKSITLGMPESKMIRIMGGGYNKSLFITE